jgi:DtxR family Mn-dependent transcriptional regulator
MDDLVDTTEMYLKSVLELEEENVPALRARISQRLEQAGPTVSQTVARMERDGLVVVSADRHLELTDSGRRAAINVMRKHRLAECLLSEVIGLDWEHLHEEACRWEHVMSDQVEQRLVGLLSNPTVTPYGNPIPAPGELTMRAASETGTVNLVRFVADSTEPIAARVRWIGEPLQVFPAMLGTLQRAGVVPDATGTVALHGPGVLVTMDGAAQTLELPHQSAAHIFVTAVD